MGIFFATFLFFAFMLRVMAKGISVSYREVTESCEGLASIDEPDRAGDFCKPRSQCTRNVQAA